ncbi:hypothetical protein J1N35_041024, partial [Gossypium stocksii]
KEKHAKRNRLIPLGHLKWKGREPRILETYPSLNVFLTTRKGTSRQVAKNGRII